MRDAASSGFERDPRHPRAATIPAHSSPIRRESDPAGERGYSELYGRWVVQRVLLTGEQRDGKQEIVVVGPRGG